jgi:hypothetical protein
VVSVGLDLPAEVVAKVTRELWGCCRRERARYLRAGVLGALHLDLIAYPLDGGAA